MPRVAGSSCPPIGSMSPTPFGDGQKENSVTILAAAIGFLSGIALIVVRDLVERIRRRRDRAEELRWLMYLFAKEIVEGTGRLRQFVRQVAMSTASKSKLSLFMGASQMAQAGALGAGGEFLNAVHNVYRLFDLVQNQVSKFSTSKNTGDFAAILAFVRDEFDLYSKSVDVILVKTGRAHEGVVPADIWRACRHLLKNNLPDFDWGPDDPKLTNRREPNLPQLREDFDEYRSECNDWLAAYQKISELFADTISDDIVKKWVEGMQKDRLRWKTLRCILGVIDAAKEQMVVFDLEEDTSEPAPLPQWNWDKLLDLGYALAEMASPNAGSSTQYEVLAKAVKDWRSALQRYDKQPYD